MSQDPVSHNTSPLQNITKRLVFFIEPSSRIIGQANRQQARTQSAFLLSQLIATITVWVVLLVFLQGRGFILSSISSIALIVLYSMSRTRFYRFASYIYVLWISLFLFVIAIIIPTDLPERILNYLALIVVVTSLVMSLRVTILLLVLYTITLLIFPLAHGSTEFSISVYLSLSYLLLLSIPVILSMTVRRNQITQLNEKSKALAESESRAHSLMEASQEAIAIYNQDGQLLDVNSSFERMFGYSHDEVLQMTPVDFFPRENRGAMLRMWTDHINTTFEAEALKKDGTRLIIYIAIRPYTYMEKPAYVAAVQDITEKKIAERERLAHEKRYRALYEQTNDAVFIIGLDGTYIDANQQVVNMLGYERDELIGKHFNFTLPEQEQPKGVSVLQRLLQGEKIPPYERMMRAKGGGLIPVEINATLVRDADGNPQHIQSIVRDIRERKRSEEGRLQLSMERERVTVLHKFINDMSHDFRTPLTTMKTSAYLIRKLEGHPEKQAKHINQLDFQLDRMERLVNDLLLMSRLENMATDKITMRDLDINYVIKEIIASITSRSENSADTPTITYELADSLPAVYGNTVQLGMVMRHLIENAITYTPAHGKIHVRTFLHEKNIVVEVTDTGIGIAEEDLPYIFDSFYRADAARNTDTGGTGLGLAIAKKIIEKHRGQITADSKVNQGTTIHIRLPDASHLTQPDRLVLSG